MSLLPLLITDIRKKNIYRHTLELDRPHLAAAFLAITALFNSAELINSIFIRNPAPYTAGAGFDGLRLDGTCESSVHKIFLDKRVQYDQRSCDDGDSAGQQRPVVAVLPFKLLQSERNRVIRLAR